MAGSIDWLYHRKNCITCKRARDFLESHQIHVKQETNAAKDKHDAKQALGLAQEATQIHVTRGKKQVLFDMSKAPPDEETLLAHILGPTGNLRAPTVRKGKQLFIGFSDELYASLQSV